EEQDPAAVTQHAMDLAAAPRPGPVHLSLASDAAVRESGAGAFACHIPEQRSPADAVRNRLAAAARPLVLIGLGAPASPVIAALIDRLQAPFLVTPKAKGIVPEDHPRFLGVASGMAIDGDILDTIRAADLVLAIGFDPVECDKTWFAKTQIAAIDSCS